MRDPGSNSGGIRPRTVLCLALLMGGLLTGAPLPAQQPQARRAAADSAAVVHVIERYHAALASGDSVAAMALLAPGAVILESGGVETREEYRSHHLPGDIAFARAVPRQRGAIRVTVHGDVAWASSTSTVKGTFRERQINSQGAELMVLRRTEQGWLIEAIHWSSRSLRS